MILNTTSFCILSKSSFFISNKYLFSFFNNFNIIPSWTAYDDWVNIKICVDYFSDFYLYRKRELNGTLKLDIIHFGMVLQPIVFQCFMVLTISLQDILLKKPNFGILFISLRLNHGCGHFYLFLR